MASLRKRKRGKSLMFEIDFYINGKRTTIPLGARYGEKTAIELRGIVETLVHAKDNGIEILGKKTLVWIESASDEIQDKLAKAGLIVQPQRKTTGELWTDFLAQQTDIGPATLESYSHAERRFFYFFKTDELLSELTQQKMEQWKQFLIKDAPNERTGGRGLAKTTTAGTLQKAKAAFNWAVRIGWIDKSPLNGVGRGSFVNEENDHYITMDEYRRLLDACPCQEWRVIIALARIGGLRSPSEVLRLKWTDINWQYPARFCVTSPKTKRYVGKGSRVVPLFPDLYDELLVLAESPFSVGAEYVINRYRDRERTNLGTQFARIVKMAGVEPILRPFDNMRASRSVEVYAEFGPFYESKWIGHSRKVAENHYLRVREVDFERAVGTRSGGSAGTEIFPLSKVGFPAIEKNLPANFPAELTGNNRQRAEGQEMKKGGKP